MLKIEVGDKNEILRKVSELIKPNEYTSMIKLGNEMIKYIKNPKNSGCGLAAPQVGVNKRIIAVSLLKTREDENYKTIMMINPEIVEESNETEVDTEGCLSVPGGRGKVERSQKIKVRYIDEQKKQQTIILSHLTARIILHEIDHLDGILFTDKLVKNSYSILKNI